MRELTIDSTRIADDEDCYVIAEIGHNHGGSVQRCKELFDCAQWAGANAVKLQKRDNKTLYTEAFYNSPYANENSYGATYGQHREALEFNRRDYALLKAYAEAIGVTFFATAFDIPSADFLADLDVPAFKLASGDLTNTRLLEHVAKFGKPVIISSGGADWADIPKPLSILKHHGCPTALLQCTSGYPAKHEELNLSVIPKLRDIYGNTVIGFSDHSNGVAMGPVAYALGARIIEKHFTLDRSAKGTDQAFSLEPQGLRKLVRDLRRTRLAMGDGIKREYASERAALAKQRKDATGRVSGTAGLGPERVGNGNATVTRAGRILPQAHRNASQN